MNIQNRTPAQYLPQATCLLAGFVFALCMGLIGTSDYEQQVADADMYCAMVKEGTWPAATRPECAQTKTADAQQLANL